ncbi:MAG TPA: hypothetical protein VH350_05990 [Candidatus Sulfotelmatobacter sp.]|jgi:hypothetical protein|nr:hypothetical protein [Candidatus Sulfotelmatobacter sp.]
MVRTVAVLAVLLGTFGLQAGASATLLIEEPYGKLGFFTATGHAAVYLSGICAQTPLILRRCAPGESGVVLSRYDGVQGYDWIAIPLVPYLYAVERPEDVPLFADTKTVAFLRDRYRRKYLEDIIPDLPNGGTPKGNWYELVGSSYDRTTYGFEIETSGEQDEALILKLNSSSNHSHFHLLTRNCADFVKDLINLYQPKALHRSYVADVGIGTPKQMAKALVQFSAAHPELRLSRFIVPQVPGNIARSKAVHRVVGSFFESKKYIVPSAVANPIFAACVAAVFFASGGGRFNPRYSAMIFVPGNEPELPVTREESRAYRKALKRTLAQDSFARSAGNGHEGWEHLQSKAEYEFDQHGLVLQTNFGSESVNVGVSDKNVLAIDAPPQLIQALLIARLQSELQRSSTGKVSDRQIGRDLQLLKRATEEDDPLETSLSSLLPGLVLRVSLSSGRMVKNRR